MTSHRESHTHFQSQCPECKTIHSQCRCAGLKVTQWTLCEKCQKYTDKSPTNPNPPTARPLSIADSLTEMLFKKVSDAYEEAHRLEAVIDYIKHFDAKELTYKQNIEKLSNRCQKLEEHLTKLGLNVSPLD